MTVTVAAGAPAPPALASRCAASAAAFGWSKTTVAGSASPLSARNRLRRSTAVSESKPSSRNGRRGGISSLLACPRTAAAALRTSSCTTRSRSASPRPASRAARPEPSPSSTAASRTERTAGMSPISGRGRSAVNSSVKRGQSTSTTQIVVSSWPTARRSASIAGSGRSAMMPRRRRSAPTSAEAMPDSAQDPQAIAVIRPPRARRRSARASRAALAAAYAACE